MKKFLCLPFFSFLLATALAQPVLENNRPSLSWYQINTPHFRILYLEGFETQAQRMAGTMELLYPKETQSLTSKPRKTSIVMQSRAAQSNAFVSVLPRRAEFFTMPSQDYNFIGNNDWLDMIATHELRHIVQYAHANQGISRLVYYLGGNYGLSAVGQLAVPQWFWEGDAVATETALTTTGRGKIPNFGLVFRTNLLEDRVFNYHKQYLRSYKHFITDEYVLGYHMVSYLRRKTDDPLIWDKITGRAWRSSIVPFTLSNAIRKETGMHITELYKTMAGDLQQMWKYADTITVNPSTLVSQRRNTAYTDYRFPQTLSDGSVVAMKSGIGDIEQLVRLDKGKEEKLAVPGILYETGMMSAGGTRVVWNEYRFDPRWRRNTATVIVAYDHATNKMWDITPPRSRYSGAALSPDGTMLVTLFSDHTYEHRLVLMNVDDGSIVKTLDNPANAFYSMFRWSEDGTAIVSLKLTDQGKSVVKIDPQQGTETELLPPSDQNLGYPLLTDRYLLYNAPVSGIDNIFAYDLTQQVTVQLTNARYGAYNAELSPDATRLYYNEQGRDGLNVVRISFIPSDARRIRDKDMMTSLDPLAATLVEQEGPQMTPDSVAQPSFPALPYSKWSGMFNPYTWGPYVDNSLAYVDVGFTSQDVLSTTRLSAGYRYDINEGTGEVHAGVSFQGWYPIINAGVYYGKRKDESTLSLSAADRRMVAFEWNETGITGGVSVPLLLTRSKYLTTLTVSNDVGYTLTNSFKSKVTRNGEVILEGADRYVPANDTLYFLYDDITDYGQLISNHFSVSYTHALKQSRRDFNPKFGQFLNFESFSTPFGGDYQGWQWSAYGTLFFPGFFKHHSVYLYGGYQESLESLDLDVYTFRNRLFKPRGYGYPQNSKFTTLSGNYVFPLWYPDIAIGPVLNIQRVKLNLFYDYGEGEGLDYYYNFESGNVYSVDNGARYISAGGELTFDVNFFRTLPQFELGLRASRIEANNFNNGGWVYEFLIGNIPF